MIDFPVVKEILKYMLHMKTVRGMKQGISDYSIIMLSQVARDMDKNKGEAEWFSSERLKEE